MADDHKLSGTTDAREGRLIIVKEADWSLDKTVNPVPMVEPSNLANAAWETTVSGSGKRMVFIRTTEGEILGNGNIDPVAL